MSARLGRGASVVEAHDAILAFKRSGTAVIDGLNYAQVVALRLYHWSVADLLKKVAYALLFDLAFRGPRTSAPVLVVYSVRGRSRADYDYIDAQVSAAVADQSDHLDVVDRLNPLQAVRTLARLPRGWSATRDLGGTVAVRLVVACLVAKFLTQRSRVETLTKHRRHVVTFCDLLPVENLIAQVAHVLGKPTTTNQHGQYRELDAATMSPDAEAYENFVSDTMLVWGEATVDEMTKAGIAAERLDVVGWIHPPFQAKARAQPSGSFGVMLNGENGAESNAGLISAAETIAKDLDLTYVVRVHPTFADDAGASASDRCVAARPMSLDEFAGLADFALSHMSAATIELLMIAVPVFVLDDGHLARVFQQPGLTFSDPAQVSDAVRSGLDPATYRALGDHFTDTDDPAPRVRASILGRLA